MLTLTAPSSRPHQEFIPGRPGHHGWCTSCAGHVRRWPSLAHWNADAAKSWNRLLVALKRETTDDLRFFRAAEVQDGKRSARAHARGAIHFHVIVKWTKPVALQRIHALAKSAGFGCVLDWKPIDPGSRWAGHYVAKYVTKTCDDRVDGVPWAADRLNRYTGELTTGQVPTFRAWSCSRAWGVTMAEIVQASRDAAQRARDVRALVAASADPFVQVDGDGAPPG